MSLLAFGALLLAAAVCNLDSPPGLKVRVGRASGPIVGASVTVSATERVWQRTERTNAEGVVAFEAEDEGSYSVEITCDESDPCDDIHERLRTVTLKRGSSLSMSFTPEEERTGIIY
jgi:hypothetical protein